MADSIVGLDGKTVSSHDERGVRLDMPYIVTWTITAIIQGRDANQAKAGLAQAISVRSPVIPHVMGVEVEAQPVPPEMLAEMLAQQQRGVKKG